MNRQTAKYRDFVLLALFAAIILLLAFTPIGYIQLPIIKATIVHVPVILGAIAVSYTHLDVYKRQIQDSAQFQTG